MQYAIEPCPKGCGRDISTRPSALQNHLERCAGPARDKRRGNKGASKRQAHTFAYKWRVLRDLDEMQKLMQQWSHLVKIHPLSDTAESHGLNKSLLSKWNTNRKPIIKAAKANRSKRKTKAGTNRYKFADVDTKVNCVDGC